MQERNTRKGSSPPSWKPGEFDGDALVYRSELPIASATLKLRNVARVAKPGKIESEEYSAMPGAPETLLVHVEARKN